MATIATQAVQAAKSQDVQIPVRLMNFFTRYPPHKYSIIATGQELPTLKQRVGMGSKPLSATNLPSSIASEQDTSDPELSTLQKTSQTTTSTKSSGSTSKIPPSPFLPYKNPQSGRWRGALIGLRRQAELFKIARAHDMEEFLPPSVKSTEFKQRRALEKGLAVKGTGEGQKVKGHKWERQIAVTMEKRRKAMEEMPEMIRLWAQRGHGRGWKKYPK